MGSGMIALQVSIAVMIGTLAVLAGMVCTKSRQAKRPVSSVEQDAKMTRAMAEIAAEMRRLGG
jgi:hypothetical protein